MDLLPPIETLVLWIGCLALAFGAIYLVLGFAGIRVPDQIDTLIIVSACGTLAGSGTIYLLGMPRFQIIVTTCAFFALPFVARFFDNIGESEPRNRSGSLEITKPAYGDGEIPTLPQAARIEWQS